MKTVSSIAVLLAALALPAAASTAVSTKQVTEHYADLAYKSYSDALASARVLQQAVNAFVDSPGGQTHQAARHAWLAAREPYGQTEVFRFGNPNVDDWEGQVNAWPLDEGLIDYVAGQAYEYEEGNEFATANIIASDQPVNVELLRSLHETGGSEANVATGYHAIEFLLWGQDLNADPQDHGQRPYTDFVTGEGCTHGNCTRRALYLKAATDLLVSDLEYMATDWAPGSDENYRAQFVDLDEDEALRRMLFGMGSLSLGELAGERMNVALLASSQEDEHSCFSDNTHIDIVENARGIRNVYLGEYTGSDGNTVTGASLSQLARQTDPELDQQLQAALDRTMEDVGQIESNARSGLYFDQQILPEHPDANQQVRNAIGALKAQTLLLEQLARTLGIDKLQSQNSDSFNG